jgi:hypothetical protein
MFVGSIYPEILMQMCEWLPVLRQATWSAWWTALVSSQGSLPNWDSGDGATIIASEWPLPLRPRK